MVPAKPKKPKATEETVVATWRNYPEGVHECDQVDLEEGVTQVGVRFIRYKGNEKRGKWPEREHDGAKLPVLAFVTSVSYDGGANWTRLLGGAAHGGTVYDKDGAETDDSAILMEVPSPDRPRKFAVVFETMIDLHTEVVLTKVS